MESRVKTREDAEIVFGEYQGLPSTYVGKREPRFIYFPVEVEKASEGALIWGKKAWDKFSFEEFKPFVVEDHQTTTEVFWKLAEAVADGLPAEGSEEEDQSEGEGPAEEVAASEATQ